ncbi:MAG: hypothetical protein FWG30_07820 [Eubacteriaceae bacterium]|nr:hypothetical protein [Eubacteriaceae bacterium]
MTLLTPKENHLRIGRHEIPEWVPTMMPYKDHGRATQPAGIFAMGVGQGEFVTGWRQPQGEWKDFWGASYIWEEGVIAGLPKPNAFLIDDITKWSSFITRPEVPDLDWEAMAKAELDNIDREQVAVTCDLGMQPFQNAVALLGFTETLCALYEEPEALKEMLDYMATWWVEMIELEIKHWKPDIVTMADDTAAKLAPFFSKEMYDEFFKPIYFKITAPARDRGILVDYHNCGKCESYVPSMVEFVNYWNPCEMVNDMRAVKKEYGHQIALTGCWDYTVKLDDTEETVRGYVREYLDTFAKGGGLIAWASAGSFTDPPEVREKWAPLNEWITDEIYEYGTAMYK